MKKRLIALLLLLTLTFAFAQDSGDNNSKKTKDQELTKREPYWTATMSSGQYFVWLGRIIGTAKHSYVLDGLYLINEVTIETEGAAQVRFYHVEQLVKDTNFTTINEGSDRAAELAQEAAQRIGGGLTNLTKDNMVFKQYPTTSHAKTIEFRLTSPQDLDELHGSLMKAVLSGIGRNFSCK